MKSIQMFPLPKEYNVIPLPVDTQVLSVAYIGAELMLIALVPVNEWETEERTFVCYDTGEEIERCQYKYVGTDTLYQQSHTGPFFKTTHVIEAL